MCVLREKVQQVFKLNVQNEFPSDHSKEEFSLAAQAPLSPDHLGGV